MYDMHAGSCRDEGEGRTAVAPALTRARLRVAAVPRIGGRCGRRSPPSMFKKPVRRGNLRKKRKVEEPEEDEDAEATVDVLAGMRELQKMRSRAHGINPVTAEEREREAEKKRQQKELEAQTKAEQQQGGLLNSFFEKTNEKSAIDKQMDNYIERNMALLRGEDPDAEDEKPKTAEDLLYQTPAELAAAASATRESELSGVSDIKVSNFAARLPFHRPLSRTFPEPAGCELSCARLLVGSLHTGGRTGHRDQAGEH